MKSNASTTAAAVWSRFKPWEIALWVLALASPLLLSTHALIINEIAIVALFALSLSRPPTAATRFHSSRRSPGNSSLFGPKGRSP